MVNTVCRLLAMKSKYSKIQVGKKLKQKYIQDKSYLDICKLRSLHMLICRYNIITLKLTYINNNNLSGLLLGHLLARYTFRTPVSFGESLMAHLYNVFLNNYRSETCDVRGKNIIIITIKRLV